MSAEENMNVLAETADKQCNLGQMSVFKQELFTTLKNELIKDFKTHLLSEVIQLLTTHFSGKALAPVECQMMTVYP